MRSRSSTPRSAAVNAPQNVARLMRRSSARLWTRRCSDALAERLQIAEMRSDDRFQDGRIERLVFMNCDVAKSRHRAHPRCELTRQHALAFQDREMLLQRVRESPVFHGNQVRGEIDGTLDCTLEVEHDDVLHVDVAYGGRIAARDVANPLKAALDRTELTEQHVRRHGVRNASRRFSIGARMIFKSA